MPYEGVPGLVETHEAYGETTLVVDPARLEEACLYLRDEESFNLLVDVVATDYLGWGEDGVAGYYGSNAGRDLNDPAAQGYARSPEPKPKRFSLSYLLIRVADDTARVRVRVWLDDGQSVASVVPVWPTADWYEREAFDMMGIRFDGHPNLVRILMDDDWEGHPLRKDYPDRRRARALLGGRVSIVERRVPIRGARPYAGSRIPQPVPTILQPDPGLEDVLRVNFGPNHPSTHGVLRLIVDLHGEHVVGIAAVIGYLHTGFEKTMEQKTWWKGVTYPARVDYVSFQYNELVYVLAVEKLLELKVPRKATWMRMALGELVRIHSHLVYLGTSALEIGAISMFWYCFRERDLVLDLFEMVAGTRMHTATSRSAARPRTTPSASTPRPASSASTCRRRSTTTSRSCTRTRSGSSGRSASGRSPARTRSRSGRPARTCVLSGVDWDSPASASRTSPTTRSSSTYRSTKAVTSTTGLQGVRR